ncbi:hypothetical protein [Nakamurella endophytica]|uniref:hypothetical protein n=1 Tax=Nakamurella endophytica TaxID=1748367 RepID=UPI00166E632D|nr:hypothetical protein [Nakamurella endophytica]
MRQRPRRLVAGICALVLVLVAVTVWVLQAQRQASHQARVQRDVVGPLWLLTEVRAPQGPTTVQRDDWITLRLEPNGTSRITTCSGGNTTTARWRATSSGFEMADPVNDVLACNAGRSRPKVVSDATSVLTRGPLVAERSGDALVLRAAPYELRYRIER